MEEQTYIQILLRGAIHMCYFGHSTDSYLQGWYPCIIIDQTYDSVQLIPLGKLKKLNRRNYSIDTIPSNRLTGLDKERIVLYGCIQIVNVQLIQNQIGRVNTGIFNKITNNLNKSF